MFKRFYHTGEPYFITTKTKNNIFWFVDYQLCEIVINNLRLSKKLYCFDIYAFIVMPDHLHLLICPKGNYNISQIMKYLKQNISRDINRLLGTNVASTPSSKLSELGIAKYGYDIYANSGTAMPAKTTTASFPQEVGDCDFCWQHSFHDRLIRNNIEFNNVLNYINEKNLADLIYKYKILTEENAKDYPFYSYTNPDLIDPY